MRLISYAAPNLRVGAVVDDNVLDLRGINELALLDAGNPHAAQLAELEIPADFARFVSLWIGRDAELQELISTTVEDEDRMAWLASVGIVRPLNSILLLPPVIRPGKLLNVGSSYLDHAQHVARSHGIANTSGTDISAVKLSFFKPATSLLRHGAPLRYTATSTAWDFEGELALVIGRACRHVTPDDVSRHVYGFTVFNDASQRDVPQALGGLTSPRGKAGDTLAPMGPWVVPCSALQGRWNDLSLRTWVNDELRQDTRTSQLLWPIEQIVAEASEIMTLQPGDVIATGTPGGIGLEDGRYLSVGDRVRIEIEGIGTLENPVGPPFV